ncbi:expressed unknown protein [Seminavis robusta]|uniref:KANL3/Tex30 alpha/beta hydrolase-like domain-containing protein n=1 Tax=Seminavis robusta TaxID=568900 RepID=A0A9N8HTM2_9STRA|nr:expressed unknown protein [Seminavis robusta]|eukprot:Sro1681_g290840.1 n/a (250) ;mRNA; r:15059-15808
MSDNGNKKKRLMTDFFGGGKTKKTKTSATVFLVCPGAGGVLPKDGTLEAQLGRMGRVAVIPKSTGYNGRNGCVAGSNGSLNQNLQIVNDHIAQEAASSNDDEIVLVGQSFGCRAIVHWICGNHEVRTHPSIPVPWSDDATPDNYQELRHKIQKVVFFGYPLDHAKQDRSAALKLLPENVRACFVIGTSDKLALGDKLNQEGIKETVESTLATTQIIWVEKGGHGPPNEKTWTGMNLNKQLEDFLSAKAE